MSSIKVSTKILVYIGISNYFQDLVMIDKIDNTNNDIKNLEEYC